MQTNKTEGINLSLMILSLVLAIVFPFRLFLLTYAVLGPLHYLTEINWLNRRDYFMKDRRWIWFYAEAALLITVPVLLHLPIFSSLLNNPFVNELIVGIKAYTDVLLLSVFTFAIGLLFFKKLKQLLIFLVASVLFSYLVTTYVLNSYILIGIFLPTLIHVYFFTLLFMLRGTLFKPNKMGWAAIITLIVIPFVILYLPVDLSFYSDYVPAEAVNTASNFQFIKYLGDNLGIMFNGKFDPLTIGAIKLQTFVAFAFTYHYMNWFSKASLIGWYQNVPRHITAIVLLIWGGLVALTAYDYEIGYIVLYGFALLHVLFEFPLNIASAKDIGGLLLKKKNH